MRVLQALIFAALGLSLGAAHPARAQDFKDRWSPVPKAEGAERPAPSATGPSETGGNEAQPEPQGKAPANSGASAQDSTNNPQTLGQSQRSEDAAKGPGTPSGASSAAPVREGPAKGRDAAKDKPRSRQNAVMVGKASFYAYKKGTTASGERFDRDRLTAASRTLPFGTRLKVTDVKTDKSVDVTVTDRGPRSRSRILDLSAGAAKALGVDKERGVINVRAEVLD